MTFKEAEEKMAAMPELGYRTVEFETRFHKSGNVDRVCKLYAEKHNGILVDASSWERCFDLLDTEITKRLRVPAAEDQAPMDESMPIPEKEVETDASF